MSAPKPQVGKLMGRWIVRCDCAPGGVLPQFGGITWVKAADFPTALALANWHATLHRTCPTCGHTDPVLSPTVVDAGSGLLSLAGDLHQVIAGKVRRLEPTP